MHDKKHKLLNLIQHRTEQKEDFFPWPQLFYFPDASSVFQSPSSPEEEDELNVHKAEQDPAVDPIAASPSGEAAHDLVGLDVTTENLCDTNIPEVQDAGSEASPSAGAVEEETSEPPGTDSWEHCFPRG